LWSENHTEGANAWFGHPTEQTQKKKEGEETNLKVRGSQKNSQRSQQNSSTLPEVE